MFLVCPRGSPPARTVAHAAAGAARRAADAEFADAEREREEGGNNPREADGESRGGGAFRTLFDAVEAYLSLIHI